MKLPRLLITMGDVAGIGPEIIAQAWPRLQGQCQPVVIGDPRRLPPDIPCDNPSSVDLSQVRPGQITAEGGQAAYDWLAYAIQECLAGRAEGIVTCPLHKEGLHLAGLDYPGHTEILAHHTGAKSHAMLLYDDQLRLAVAHVTLHRSLRSIFDDLTPEAIQGKIQLLGEIVPQLTGQPASLGVAALNPHASDGGLFGDEEARLISPAIAAARQQGWTVEGPVAADAIFLPHYRQRFNGIVAMYHDQGHIAMKLLGGRRAVNVTAGLPIVRTSVAHGTAYDIAGRGLADELSLVSAVRVAARLVQARQQKR